MKQEQGKAFVVRREQVKPFVATTPDHREVQVMLSPGRDGTLPGVACGVVEIPAGFSSPPHHHEVEQESWYFFEGKGQIQVGDELIDVEPGTMVVSPPKTSHNLINPGPATLKAVFMFSPSGPEKSMIAG